MNNIISPEFTTIDIDAMCENFRKQFFDKVMTKVGDETLLDTLKKNFEFTYFVCRNSKSSNHPKCKKYYVKLKNNILGDSCDQCKMHFCEACFTTSFINRPGSYTYEKTCFECLIKKDYFKARVLSCPVCSNNNSYSFVYDQEFDAFFCFNCRNRSLKTSLKLNNKISETIASGTGQDTAIPIVGHYSVITGVSQNGPQNCGVVLPEPKKNYCMTLINKCENNVNVYPSIGCRIGERHVNVPIILSQFQSITFIGETDTSWESLPF